MGSKRSAYQKSREIVRKAIDYIKKHGWVKGSWQSAEYRDRYCIMGTLCHVEGRCAGDDEASEILVENGPLRYSLAKAVGAECCRESPRAVTRIAVSWNDQGNINNPSCADDVVKKLEQVDADLAHCEAQVIEEEKGNEHQQ